MLKSFSVLALIGASLSPAFANDEGSSGAALALLAQQVVREEPQAVRSQAPALPLSRPSARRGLTMDLERAAAYRPLIAKHASAHGVPLELADAVVRIESRYNPNARNGPNLGLTQINPLTARSLGFNGPASALLDPDTNLQYGIKYLAGAYKLAGGDICGAILRYQAGHRATRMTGAASAYCARAKTIMASR